MFGVDGVGNGADALKLWEKRHQGGVLVFLSWAAGWERARPGLHSAAGCVGSGMCGDSGGPGLWARSTGCRARQSRTPWTSCRSCSASHPHSHCYGGKKGHVFMRGQQSWLKPANNSVTHTTEQAKEPLWVWLSLIKKVPSLRPFRSSSASFRFIFPTYQLLSSWWVSSARVYGLEDFTKKKKPFIESLCLWGFTQFTLEISLLPPVVGCFYCSQVAL